MPKKSRSRQEDKKGKCRPGYVIRPKFGLTEEVNGKQSVKEVQGHPMVVRFKGYDEARGETKYVAMQTTTNGKLDGGKHKIGFRMSKSIRVDHPGIADRGYVYVNRSMEFHESDIESGAIEVLGRLTEKQYGAVLEFFESEFKKGMRRIDLRFKKR